ncbi:MAG: hypothetical protein MRY83_16475 [Flavobacteriales bacterium]|nr:hypothetical protein [Flavobacteriales bacterium]
MLSFSKGFSFCLLIIVLSLGCFKEPNRDKLNITNSAIETCDFVFHDIPELSVDIRNLNLIKNSTGLVTYNDVPFSGHLMTYHENDSLKLDESYFQGHKENTSKRYYSNGALQYSRTYRDGEKHGVHKGWHPNGQIKYEMTFVHGFSEGKHEHWYSSGQPYKVQHYHNGREFGSQKVWRPDGKIRANYVIRENGKKYGLMGLKRCYIADEN